ncbi:MAG: AI-2E family transporter, partial [Solobacterium sp.]|nr:AI-2E family transporter [Solobacterium sp.]
MRNPWTPETQNRIREYTISGVIIAIACFALMHVQEIISFLLLIWKALAPFIWGFCIAFILSPLSRMCEERWIVNWKVSPKLKRVISVAVALILFVLIITLFFVILIPQLINSFNSLISSMDGYISTLEQFLQRFGQYQELDDILISVYEMVKENLVGWVSGSNGIVTKVLSYSVNVVRGVLNFFIGIIIAIYLLLDKERWKKQ